MAAAGSIAFPLVNPRAGEILQIGFPAFLFTAMAFGWGLYLRARRELVASLRQRAEQLEADQIRNAELAREAERRSIAREMHDVLAHRLSLLSVHAGALQFHPDAPAADIASAATVIRTSASAALDELREIVTVLREEPDDAAGPPSPVSASSAAFWKSPGLRGWSWTPASTCPARANCPRRPAGPHTGSSRRA